jgi:hypothetical protein
MESHSFWSLRYIPSLSAFCPYLPLVSVSPTSLQSSVFLLCPSCFLSWFLSPDPLASLWTNVTAFLLAMGPTQRPLAHVCFLKACSMATMHQKSDYHLFKEVIIYLNNCFFGHTDIWTRGLALAWQTLYYLSHVLRPI